LIPISICNYIQFNVNKYIKKSSIVLWNARILVHAYFDLRNTRIHVSTSPSIYLHGQDMLTRSPRRFNPRSARMRSQIRICRSTTLGLRLSRIDTRREERLLHLRHGLSLPTRQIGEYVHSFYRSKLCHAHKDASDGLVESG
jgi:hypothetical protein